MGCAPSMIDEKNREGGSLEDNEQSFGNETFNLDSKDPQQMLRSYIAIDKEIMRREYLSPAPIFGQTVARQNQLRQIVQVAEDTANQLKEDSNDITDIFADLGLRRGPKVAAEHEEFLANTNRALLSRNMVLILKRRLQILEKKVEAASKDVLQLQNLYQQQDLLLKNIFGESYGSEKEKNIEQELDTMRNYRDTLASGVVQWEDSAFDIKVAAELANRGVNTLTNMKLEKSLNLASAGRDAIQEAVFLIQLSQETLSSVQFPYCTTRELSAILQAIEYIFTDILIDERYKHAMQVYTNFQQRAVALHSWILKTLNGSLKRDLSELDTKVVETSYRLRRERVELICKNLKIKNFEFDQLGKPETRPGTVMPEPTSVYQKPMRPESRYTQQNRYGDVLTPGAVRPRNDSHRIFTDPNLQREFENKMAYRRSAMWPSRRLEDLRQLNVNDF